MRVVVPPLLRASLALVLALALVAKCSGTMTALELSELRNSTVQLFRHAFGSYMAHAFPMDELLPLSCKGTNSFGGVSVTLIDSLDTLAVMGLREEFALAVEVCVALHAAAWARRDTPSSCCRRSAASTSRPTQTSGAAPASHVQIDPCAPS